MLKRIFIAINLPKETKESILRYTKEKDEMFDNVSPIQGKKIAKWTGSENLHITLDFLGNVKESRLESVYEVAKEAAKNSSAFEISLTKAVYGPPGKIPPKMIWLLMEKSEELKNLKFSLSDKLSKNENIKFQKETREFNPHITLARINSTLWRRIEPDERPDIEEELNLSFKPKSIEVMESRLKRTGAEYTVLKSFSLLD